MAPIGTLQGRPAFGSHAEEGKGRVEPVLFLVLETHNEVDVFSRCKRT